MIGFWWGRGPATAGANAAANEQTTTASSGFHDHDHDGMRNGDGVSSFILRCEDGRRGIVSNDQTPKI